MQKEKAGERGQCRNSEFPTFAREGEGRECQ